MARRKLTQHQKARIQKIQQARRERADNRAVRKDEQLSQSLGQEQTGLVISHHGASLVVEDDAGQLIRCVVRQNLGVLVCGDRVVWQASGEQEGVIVAILPRRTLLARPEMGGGSRPFAANLDRIVIVAATQPAPSQYLIDRYLVAAETTGIHPIIVINKIDLVSPEQRAPVEDLAQAYRDIGYEVLFTSVKQEHGLDPLIGHLKNRTSILVGQSGVGKSSLVKALLPDRDIQIGHLTEAQLGRHTTTTSVLYHLTFGGELIDSPGVRDFGVWHIDRAQIVEGFVEFRKYLGGCKFSNCSHTTEPGCALLRAVKEGEIQARRLESYHEMVRSADTM
jgi:ribosome biogenesis GTPase